MVLKCLVVKKVELCGCLCEVQRISSKDEEWQIRPLYLFISLKNRKFTRDFIQWFITLCHSLSSTGIICVVDEPYLFNLKADLGVDELPQTQVAKLEKLSWEIGRKAQKAINASNSTAVSILSWQELSRKTPEWMKEEIAVAFDRRGIFYQQVLRQVVLMKGDRVTEDKLEKLAGFFLCEMPVLIYAYYSITTGIVDVYPGDNPDIFWQIEMGIYQEELPKTTEFALKGKPLVYINASVELISCTILN